MVTQCVETGEVFCWHEDPTIQPCAGTIEEGVAYLLTADRWAGHNELEYDSQVLLKLGYIAENSPLLDPDKKLDTLILSRLVYSDRKEKDFVLFKQERLEGKFIGQHSLGAWGQRLGNKKGDYDGGWEEFSQAMLDYCVQDVALTTHLLVDVLLPQLPSFSAAGLTTVQAEHRFALQLFEQEQRGSPLDKEAGMALLERLSIRRAELMEEIKVDFPDLKHPYKPYPNGKPRLMYCKLREGKFDHKLIPFNPNSRKQLAARLTNKHGWVPKELTAKGEPAMHERVLLDLAQIYPEVGRVAEFIIVNNRISILQDGPQGYFKMADENHRLHGRTLHIGTVTHRCAHSKPNKGNVTSIRKPYGKELRSVFIPFPGFIQAGWDADGLELRMLAHYLGRYDGGEYAAAVLHGNKEEGTDPHSLHAKAISTVVDCDRDKGKNFTYAYLYGAGDMKLGKMGGGGKKLGRAIRNAMAENIPGLKALLRSIQDRVHQPDHSLISLDGRRVGIRHEHAALNSLLQTAGATVMRWVPVLHEGCMVRAGIVPGCDFKQTGHIHDEVQGSLRPGLEAAYQKTLEEAFAKTTDALQLRVPVTGTAEFGKSWADTH